MRISLSSSKEQIKAFIKVMYCFVMAKNDNDQLTDELAEIIEDNMESALQFVTDHSMGKVQFRSLFQQAVRNKGTAKCGEKLTICLKAWRDNNKDIKSDVTISKVEIGILNDLKSFLNKEGENAYNRLENNAVYTEEPDIYENFLPEEQDPIVHLDQLKKLVAKYAPDSPNKMKIPLERLKELKETHPDIYKEHSKIKNNLKKIYLKELLFFVRKSGKRLLDVNVVKDHMYDNTIPYPIPRGFVGQIDEKGKFYTVKGRKTEGRMLRTNPSGKCIMNPQYSPDTDDMYVLRSTPIGGVKEQMIYTVDNYRRGQFGKFEKVESAIPLMPEARAKWQARMMGKSSLDQMIALMCETAYLTSARIGSRDGNVSKGHQIYGLSTLRCKHAKVMSSGRVIFNYRAKSAMEQHHEISPTDRYTKEICDYVADRKADADPEDFLFAYDDKRIQPTRVNEYLRSLGLPITIHKFRTVHGTTLFRELASKSKLLKKSKIDPKELNKEIDSLLEEVGKKLGHFTRTDDGQKVTGNTALAYYINPPSVAEYYDKFKVHYPAKLLRVIENSKTEEED